MKKLRIVKIILSSVWLGGTIAVLVFWLCVLKFPWNTTNLWLIPLFLIFPLWAFVGALRKTVKPLALRVIKGVILCVSLLPLLVVSGLGVAVSVRDNDASNLLLPVTLYRLESRTDDPADYGVWDVWIPQEATELFPKELPAAAKNPQFSSVFYSTVTSVWQSRNTLTLSYSLDKQTYQQVHLAMAEQYGESDDKAAYKASLSRPDGEQTYQLTQTIYSDTGVSVTFDPEEYSVCYRYGEAIWPD